MSSHRSGAATGSITRNAPATVSRGTTGAGRPAARAASSRTARAIERTAPGTSPKLGKSLTSRIVQPSALSTTSTP